MYTPRSFKIEDLATLHALISEHSFGIVFSQEGGKSIATHLPWMIDPTRGPNGTLIGHMARANPHWKNWNEKTELLVVFQGPHSYISPAWYTDQVTVPTWNYAAVHAYGVPTLITEPDKLRYMVESLIEFHEAKLGFPWDSSKKESVMLAELQGIVGFEIPIDRIEGKWKFNQNRTREDQAGVIKALRGSENQMYQAVADIMEKSLE